MAGRVFVHKVCHLSCCTDADRQSFHTYFCKRLVGRQPEEAPGRLVPSLLQDIYDEFVAKTSARAQSAEVGGPLNPSTKGAAPAMEEAPGPAHMISALYDTLDEVTLKPSPAAARMQP